MPLWVATITPILKPNFIGSGHFPIPPRTVVPVRRSLRNPKSLRERKACVDTASHRRRAKAQAPAGCRCVSMVRTGASRISIPCLPMPRISIARIVRGCGRDDGWQSPGSRWPVCPRPATWKGDHRTDGPRPPSRKCDQHTATGYRDSAACVAATQTSRRRSTPAHTGWGAHHCRECPCYRCPK